MQLTINLTKRNIAALRDVLGAERGLREDHTDGQATLDETLLRLLAAAEPKNANQRRHTGACRRCGCTQDNACPVSCSWVASNLCSECLTPEEKKNPVYKVPFNA